MRWWKRCYLLVARFFLFLLEGPSKPWWISRTVMFSGAVVFVATIGKQSSRRFAAVAFCCVIIGVIWNTFRQWQITAVAAMATQPLTHCPFCKYSLSGVTEDKCPECGRRPREETERLRDVMGIDSNGRKL